MGNEWEVFLTIFVLSFWILFPVGMFLSMSHVDKNTDQIIRLEKLRHLSLKPAKTEPQIRELKRPINVTRPISKAG
jgi:hypothetical protein